MANALYGKAREAFLNGDIDWANDTINCVLIDVADYTVDIDVHDFLDDVPVAARVGTPQTIGTKSSTLGVADGGNVTFPTVTGDPCEALIIYKHTGSDATAALIAYIDSATGLPVTPNGGDINVNWDDGANKIFKL